MKCFLIQSLCCSLLAGIGFAQQPQPESDVPNAAIVEVKPIPEGGLLLAVRIHASKGKSLDLFHAPNPPVRSGPPQPGDDDPLPFSLAGSTLRDLYTEKVYTCLPSLPDTPFVGPMTALIGIRPGGWIQLGVAFPPIAPPPEKDGKTQPYQLLFEIPKLKIHTLIKLDPNTLKPL